MSLTLTEVIQLSSFFQIINFGSNINTLTDNVVFSNVTVTTFPSGSVSVLSSPSSNILLLDNTTPSSNLLFIISGFYGLDIAVDDIYRVVTFPNTEKITTTFTNFNSLEQATYDHIFEFLPQNWSFQTYEYFFKVTSNNVTTIESVIQDVYPDVSRHLSRIESIVSKERI